MSGGVYLKPLPNIDEEENAAYSQALRKKTMLSTPDNSQHIEQLHSDQEKKAPIKTEPKKKPLEPLSKFYEDEDEEKQAVTPTDGDRK